MPSSGMLRHVALARIGVSDERRATIIRVTRISELGTLEVTSNQCTLEVLRSS
jgi:acetolactate synthase small subunit